MHRKQKDSRISREEQHLGYRAKKDLFDIAHMSLSVLPVRWHGAKGCALTIEAAFADRYALQVVRSDVEHCQFVFPATRFDPLQSISKTLD
jgi:hypothetical protein